MCGMSRATTIYTHLPINFSTHERTHVHTHTHTNTHTKIPPLEEATKEHREALQQELARVLQTANSDSTLYVAVAADTHPEVATCEKAIEDMLAHEQKAKEGEELEQREEDVQARTDKLLAELRAAREKVRVWRFCMRMCVCVCVYVNV